MTPSLDDATRRRIAALCADIYGDTGGERVAVELDALVSQFAPRLAGASGVELDQRAAVLITYADILRDDERPPLRVLLECLREKLTGLVPFVHLLPFFTWSSDDGFAVCDYLAVDPRNGEWSDVEAIGREMPLAFDFVLNHVSAQSAWFAGYRRGEEPYRRFFIEQDPTADLSAVVRPRSLPLLTQVETAAGPRQVWTTFSPDQVDLNFAEPEVLLRMLAVMLEYLARGARILRLDAVAFLWKRAGTTCLHLPETHAVVQLLRAVCDALVPGSVILTETNVPHPENVSYFGTKGNEAQMVYQFPLPVLTAHALLRGDGRYLRQWTAALAPPPAGCTFLNFLASHDGIGVRPATGILPAEEVDFLCSCAEARGGAVSTKANPDGSASPYELNVNYFDLVGGERSEAEAVAAFVTAHSILLAMPGVPGIYFHSLFGSRGWLEGVADTGRARTINREKLEWPALRRELDEPGHRRRRVFERLSAMLRVRRETPAFHPAAGYEVLDADPRLFVLARTAPDGQQVLTVHNLSAEAVPYPLPKDRGPLTDLLGGAEHTDRLELTAHGCLWLT